MFAGEQTALSGLALGLCQDSSRPQAATCSRCQPAGRSLLILQEPRGQAPRALHSPSCEPQGRARVPTVSPAVASPARARAGLAGPLTRGWLPRNGRAGSAEGLGVNTTPLFSSLKALYAGMNSFSQGDLKALLTKWVTFLGIFIRLVRFCRARRLFWNFRSDIKATKEVGIIWNAVEFWLLGYREMGGDVWQGLCTFVAAHKFQIYRLK